MTNAKCEMTDQAKSRSKVQHDRLLNADGVHRDDRWVCETDATHVFIKLFGPFRVESRDDVLDDAQHVLIRDGLCPLCE